jgi:NADPH-dependent 2,4-dienoyl-CoA reductase/sulfur reductase-like enzyme
VSAVTPAECVIVGGGVAGLTAAQTVARYGIRPVLIDENRDLDGPHSTLPSGFAPVGGASRDHPRLADVRALGVDIRLGAVAWGVFDQRTVAFTAGERTERVDARHLILAAGAFDRPVPFPGWTLPGVVTAGGALNLMIRHRVLPGRRALLVGSGPILPAVAYHLLRGGAHVAGIYEAARAPRRWRHSPRLLPHLDFVQEQRRYRRAIKAARVPFLPGHVIRRAVGTREVTGAVVSRCDRQWSPVGGTELHYDVDTVIVGYGSVASLELARLAGCEIRYEPSLDRYVPVRNRELESTVPNIFIAGGGTGPSVARAEGHLAALAVANRLGRLAGNEYSREASRARGRLRHLDALRRLIDEFYGFGLGLYALAEGETTLCRCEEVSVTDAVAAVRDGAVHVDEVRAWSRAGMGRCQGRMCGTALAHLIARTTGTSVASAGVFTPRPPIKPVSLGALAHVEH